MQVCVCVCVCAHCSCTNFLPGARHADTVFRRNLGHRVDAGSAVLSKAKVIIGAQVNHASYHLTCVPAGRGGERDGSREAIGERPESAEVRGGGSPQQQAGTLSWSKDRAELAAYIYAADPETPFISSLKSPVVVMGHSLHHVHFGAGNAADGPVPVVPDAHVQVSGVEVLKILVEGYKVLRADEDREQLG